MKKILLCSSIGALLLLCGCQYAPGLVDRTVAYNQAISDSTNKVLLLNIVRANKRLPTYYSRTTGDTAVTTTNPSIQFTLPFTDLSKTSAQLSMGATVTNQNALQNLDDQKFINGIMLPLKLDTYNLYANAGWPPELLMLMFVNEIDVPKDYSEKIITEVNKRCSQPIGEKVLRCKDASEPNLRDCLNADGDAIILTNNPALGRKAKCFQNGLRALLILGLHSTENKTFEVKQQGLPIALHRSARFVDTILTNDFVITEVSNPHATTTLAVCKAKAIAGFAFDKDATKALGVNQASKQTPAQECARAAKDDSTTPEQNSKVTLLLEPKGQKSKPDAIGFKLRSLEGMVYFLGQIVRAQTALKTDIYIPKVVIPPALNVDKDEVPLFDVTTDYQPGSAVSVEYDGSTYSIPSLTDESHTLERPTSRSLDVLQLINQIWGLQKEQSTQPVTPTVTVIAP